MVVQRPAGGAPQNDEWRCEEALRVAGSTFTDSWDHLAGDRPLTRACELSRIAAAVRLLDRMGDLLDKAFADFEGQQRDHADSEKAKISAIVGRSRPERNEYLQQARAQIAAHERAAAEADAAGNPDLAKISRIQAATSRELISTVSNMGSITDTQGEIATLLVDSARFVEIAALRGDLHRARRKGRATRLRARWANPLAIGAVGLVAGVVATQIFSKTRSPTLAPSYPGSSPSLPGRCSTTSSSRVCASGSPVCS